MDEYGKHSNRTSQEAPEKIDITGMVQNLYHAVKRFWWLVVILTLIFAVKEYFSVSSSYVPQYVASATVSVSSSGGSSSEDLANLFPYMMSNGVLDEVIAEDMGTQGIPGSINMAADGSFLTISATASEPQMAYDLLVSVMNNYPDVAKFVFGNVSFMILDETGVPEDTGKEVVIRGSYKRGALKGAVIGMVILLLYALSRTTVKSKNDLKKKMNLMECGSIPHVRQKKRKKETFSNSLNLLNERIPQGYVEAMRKVRTKVLRELEEKNLSTLLVTSSVPGEGKTTFAVNLAISIAQQGKRVILLDCDLRNPSVKGIMNDTEEYPGLAATLEKKVQIKDALTTIELPTEAGSLKVLYGHEEENANTRVLRSKRMHLLIEYCKRNADIVILDTAPSGLLADAPIIAKYVDAAIYVVRNDFTKMRQIREGIQALTMSGIHLLGYVYNDDNSQKGGYGYGYSYSYRYGGYNRYGRHGHYGGYYGYRRQEENAESGTTDQFGRVYKD